MITTTSVDLAGFVHTQANTQCVYMQVLSYSLTRSHTCSHASTHTQTSTFSSINTPNNSTFSALSVFVRTDWKVIWAEVWLGRYFFSHNKKSLDLDLDLRLISYHLGSHCPDTGSAINLGDCNKQSPCYRSLSFRSLRHGSVTYIHCDCTAQLLSCVAILVLKYTMTLN